MSIVKKLTIAFLLLGLIPLIFVSTQFYLNAKDNFEKKALKDIEGISQRQQNRLALRLRQNEERLEFVKSRSSILNNLRNPKELHFALMAAKETNEHFKEISVLDSKGQVIESTNQRLIGDDLSDKEFFTNGIYKNSPSQIIKESNGDIYGYLSGPIKESEKTTAVLVIKTDNDTIFSFIQDYSGLGETGEIILVKENSNGDAIPLTPLRFKADAALSSYWPQDSSFPSNTVLKGNEGVYANSIDYRGKEVFAATQYLASHSLGLITKIDRDEALQPLTDLRNKLFLQVLIVTGIIFISSRYVASFFAKPVINLRETADKLSKGDLSARANVYGDDELGDLSKTFNHMANDIEITFNMLRDRIKENQQLMSKLEAPSAKEELEKVEKEVKDLKGKIT